MLLTVIPVFPFPSMSFVGEKRASDLPHGLNTMFATALAKMEECGTKPYEIVFGNEEDYRERAQNAILQFTDGNIPAYECLTRPPVEAWTNFLRLYEWWSAPHWTERAADGKDHYAQCADCGKTTKGTAWPEKCPHSECSSHAKWAAVHGAIGAL